MVQRMLWAVSFAMTAAACTDKAEPAYKTCVELAARNDLGAAGECKSAVAADPESKSGKAAAAKLEELKTSDLKKCKDLAAADDLPAAHDACTRASKWSADGEALLIQVDATIEKKKSETAAKAAAAQAAQAEAACTGHRWAAQCGDGFDGRLRRDSLAECEKARVDYSVAGGGTCEPCKCSTW